MNTQKKHLAGMLVASSFLALAIAGTTATTAQAATYNTTFTGTPESTYAKATWSYPSLEERCHNSGRGGEVIRKYVQDYPNEVPRVLRAKVLCQWEGA